MQLNYFAVVRLTMALMPSLLERGGHVVNISSIGVLSNAPRFSAYVSSKAAMEAWTRCAAAEFADRGVTFTIVNMPLVRTPMIAPTKITNSCPSRRRTKRRTWSPKPSRRAEAHRHAARHRGGGCHLVAPRLTEVVMNTAYRMFPRLGGGQGRAGTTRGRTHPRRRSGDVRVAPARRALVSAG
jgi:NAD(P)-dependent dehydrogenase (short-subunit alcohol dehydrogenase family)